MRDLIFKHFPLKVFSLVLAALIWLVLETNQQTGTRLVRTLFPGPVMRELELPIAVMTAARNLQPLTIEPAQASVRLVGEASVLSRITPQDIEVYVRLADTAQARGSFLVEVKAPDSVTVDSVSPQRAYVAPANAFKP